MWTPSLSVILLNRWKMMTKTKISLAKFINKYVKIKETIYLLEKPIFKTENFLEKIFLQCLLFNNVFGTGDFTILSVIPFLKMRFLYGKNFWNAYFFKWIFMKSKSRFLRLWFFRKTIYSHLLAHISKKAHGGMGEGDNAPIGGGICPYMPHKCPYFGLYYIYYITILRLRQVALRLYKWLLRGCVKKWKIFVYLQTISTSLA